MASDRARDLRRATAPWSTHLIASLLAASLAAVMCKFLLKETWGESAQFAVTLFVVLNAIWLVRQLVRHLRNRRTR